MSFTADLECPVCLLVPRQVPIYTCVLGHIICSECRPKVKKCPICKGSYLRGYKVGEKRDSRNFFAEKFLSTIERKCRYETFDCTFASLDGDELIKHEQNCDKVPEGYRHMYVVDEAKINGEEDNNDQQRNDNNAPMFINRSKYHDDININHCFALSIVFIRAFLYEFADLDKHPNIWKEVCLIGILLFYLILRNFKFFHKFMEKRAPDAFANQTPDVRRRLRYLMNRAINTHYHAMLGWCLIIMCFSTYMKNNTLSSMTDEYARLRYEASINHYWKPFVVILSGVVYLIFHMLLEMWDLNTLENDDLFDFSKFFISLAQVMILVVISISLPEIKSCVSEDIDEAYFLIFWIQIFVHPFSNSKVSFILLRLLGLYSMGFYLYDTFWNDGQYAKNTDDNYMYAFHPELHRWTIFTQEARATNGWSIQTYRAWFRQQAIERFGPEFMEGRRFADEF